MSEAQGGEGGREIAYTGPLTPGQVRALKIAVVAMGIAIIVGLAVVVAQLIRLGTRSAAVTPPSGMQQPTPPLGPSPARAPATGPADLSLAMPAGAIFISYQISGDRLAVHYSLPAGPAASEIAVVDLATANVVARVRLGNDGGRK